MMCCVVQRSILSYQELQHHSRTRVILKLFRPNYCSRLNFHLAWLYWYTFLLLRLSEPVGTRRNGSFPARWWLQRRIVGEADVSVTTTTKGCVYDFTSDETISNARMMTRETIRLMSLLLFNRRSRLSLRFTLANIL